MPGKKRKNLISFGEAWHSPSERLRTSPLFMILVIVISLLFLDQLTKYLVTKNLLLNHSYPVIRGVFHISLIHNRGAAFGILKNKAPLFIFASIFAILLIYLAIRDNKSKKFSLYLFSLCLILSGGIGNLIDRLFLGYVVDFLDFRIWPVFNVADSVITIGAILLGWCILKPPKA